MEESLDIIISIIDSDILNVPRLISEFNQNWDANKAEIESNQLLIHAISLKCYLLLSKCENESIHKFQQEYVYSLLKTLSCFYNETVKCHILLTLNENIKNEQFARAIVLDFYQESVDNSTSIFECVAFYLNMHKQHCIRKSEPWCRFVFKDKIRQLVKPLKKVNLSELDVNQIIHLIHLIVNNDHDDISSRNSLLATVVSTQWCKEHEFMIYVFYSLVDIIPTDQKNTILDIVSHVLFPKSLITGNQLSELSRMLSRHSNQEKALCVAEYINEIYT